MKHKSENGQSSFRMFWGNITFTTEPLWYRIVVIFLMLIALIIIVYLLKESIPSPNLEKDLKKLSTLF